MKHMIGVVQQLKKERERAQQQVQRIDEALAALGSAGSTGARTLSAAARRKISLAQKARWAKAEGSRDEAEAHHLTSRPQADRGGAESTVGEGQECGVKDSGMAGSAGSKPPQSLVQSGAGKLSHYNLSAPLDFMPFSSCHFRGSETLPSRDGLLNWANS